VTGSLKFKRYCRRDVRKVRYNVAVMPDHNDRDVWTWCITRVGQRSGDWSPRKYDTEEDAKRGALETLADRLGS